MTPLTWTPDLGRLWPASGVGGEAAVRGLPEENLALPFLSGCFQNNSLTRPHELRDLVAQRLYALCYTNVIRKRNARMFPPKAKHLHGGRMLRRCARSLGRNDKAIASFECRLSGRPTALASDKCQSQGLASIACFIFRKLVLSIGAN